MHGKNFLGKKEVISGKKNPTIPSPWIRPCLSHSTLSLLVLPAPPAPCFPRDFYLEISCGSLWLPACHGGEILEFKGSFAVKWD